MVSSIQKKTWRKIPSAILDIHTKLTESEFKSEVRCFPSRWWTLQAFPMGSDSHVRKILMCPTTMAEKSDVQQHHRRNPRCPMTTLENSDDVQQASWKNQSVADNQVRNIVNGQHENYIVLLFSSTCVLMHIAAPSAVFSHLITNLYTSL